MKKPKKTPLTIIVSATLLSAKPKVVKRPKKKVKK
jgi:hypothetical protein